MKDYIAAHKHCANHREEILGSKLCGCFYCIKLFCPDEILDWIDTSTEETDINEKGQTALCPKCGIDSVIGDASGFPIDISFLKKMHGYWFSQK